MLFQSTATALYARIDTSSCCAVDEETSWSETKKLISGSDLVKEQLDHFTNLGSSSSVQWSSATIGEHQIEKLSFYLSWSIPHKYTIGDSESYSIQGDNVYFE